MSYFPSHFGLFQGIIKDIVNNKNEDKIELNSSKEEIGISDYENPIENVIDSSNLNKYWVSEDSQDYEQWLTIEFKDRWISLTHIAFGTISGYPLSFDIQGLVNDDYITVYSQRGSHILSKGSQIFKANHKIVTRKFKFINKGPSNPVEGVETQTRFRISAIDFYGAVTMCNSECYEPPEYIRIPNFIQTCTNRDINLHYSVLISIAFGP